MMKKKNIFIVAAIITIAFVTNIFISREEKQMHVKQTVLEKVTISEAFEVLLHAPLWIAKDKGLFEKEGLDVEISIAGGDEKAWAAVVNEDAQFAVGDPVFVAISGEKGVPGKVVASVLNGMPFWGVAKNQSIPEIKNPTELAGYFVATLPAPSTNYALQKDLFVQAGLEPKIKEVAFGGLLPALYADEVDIALEFEPNVSKAVQEGNKIVYSLADYYPDFAFTGLIALPEYIETNEKTVQKVVNALQKANTFIRTQQTEAAVIMAKRFNISTEIANNALSNLVENNMITEKTQTTQNAWDAAVDVRLNLGDLQERASYHDYVNTDFSKQASSDY